MMKHPFVYECFHRDINFVIANAHNILEFLLFRIRAYKNKQNIMSINY